MLDEAVTNTTWDLVLYIAGQTPKSVTAFGNLKRICEAHLPGRYNIEVVDLVARPELAQEHQIIAIPTVVRKSPGPVRKVVGDLSNAERAIEAIDLHPRSDWQ